MSWKIDGESYEAVARAASGGTLNVVVGGKTVTVEARVEREGRAGMLVMTLGDGRVVRAALSREGDQRWVSTGSRTVRAQWSSGQMRRGDAHGGMAGMEAPMPGRIVRVAVQVGDVVKKGQTVVTLEAMKMEHALKAPRDGVVREVGCREGELVQAGVALVVLADIAAAAAESEGTP